MDTFVEEIEGERRQSFIEDEADAVTADNIPPPGIYLPLLPKHLRYPSRLAVLS